MFRSKQSRLLCLLFALILCFQSFGSVGVSAASDSENLVDSNIRNWRLVYDTTVTVTGEYYVLKIPKYDNTDSGLRAVIGGVYELADFNAGDSFTFSLDLAKPSDISISENYYHNMFNSGSIYIGLASNSDSVDDLVIVDDCSVQITKDNFSSYLGEHLSINFTMPNIINPCIVISFVGFDSIGESYLYQGSFIGVKNVSLINNSKAEEDSFFSRLFEWFQEKFDAIGESFSDLGNKLTDLKDGFINKITELKTSFENKISDLKESLQAKIDELKQGLIDLKDNLIEGIKSLFVPDEQAILDWKESLNTLLKDHLGIIYTCSELLTDTLNLAFDIIFDAPDTYEIKIPEVSFEAAGTTVPVFSAQNIDFSFMEKPVFKGLYSMYTVALYIFFGALEVKYALRVYRKVMNN